jgi:hypothetical protein
MSTPAGVSTSAIFAKVVQCLRHRRDLKKKVDWHRELCEDVRTSSSVSYCVTTPTSSNTNANDTLFVLSWRCKNTQMS